MRDRTRTLCPFIASTAPQRVGEEAHENGIGMPLPPAAAVKAMHDKQLSLYVLEIYYRGKGS